MWPELFKIPLINFPVNTYGVLLALSFISGLWLAAHLAEQSGYDKAKIYDIGFCMLMAVMIGSKLLLIITEWRDFVDDPGQIISFDFLRSGGVYYGGFLSALAVSFYLAHRYQISWRALADICAPGVALGQFIGRLGCFSAGCCWGKPTNSWVGVMFTERAHELTDVPIGIYLHPTQLYESLATLLITITLLYFYRHRVFKGQIILNYVLYYSLARFIRLYLG